VWHRRLLSTSCCAPGGRLGPELVAAAALRSLGLLAHRRPPTTPGAAGSENGTDPVHSGALAIPQENISPVLCRATSRALPALRRANVLVFHVRDSTPAREPAVRSLSRPGLPLSLLADTPRCWLQLAHPPMAAPPWAGLRRHVRLLPLWTRQERRASAGPRSRRLSKLALHLAGQVGALFASELRGRFRPTGRVPSALLDPRGLRAFLGPGQPCCRRTLVEGRCAPCRRAA